MRRSNYFTLPIIAILLVGQPVSAELPACGKLARAASWIIHTGYSQEETAEEILSRNTGPNDSMGLFSELPWEQQKLIGMVEQIRNTEIEFGKDDDSMWLSFQYGRYFEYQCLLPDVPFAPLSEAKPIIDKCLEMHGNDAVNIAECVIPQARR